LASLHVVWVSIIYFCHVILEIPYKKKKKTNEENGEERKEQNIKIMIGVAETPGQKQKGWRRLNHPNSL
jgi:hypothetical protein